MHAAAPSASVHILAVVVVVRDRLELPHHLSLSHIRRKKENKCPSRIQSDPKKGKCCLTDELLRS